MERIRPEAANSANLRQSRLSVLLVGETGRGTRLGAATMTPDPCHPQAAGQAEASRPGLIAYRADLNGKRGKRLGHQGNVGRTGPVLDHAVRAQQCDAESFLVDVHPNENALVNKCFHKPAN